MRRSCLLFLSTALVSGWLAAPCAAQTRRVAVLEFRGDGSIEGAGLRFLADKVREAALTHLDPADWDVMTQDNMLVLLEANAQSLAACEGECEVETGRLLGAHLVVAGSQVRFGSSYELVLRSYETESGKLLASASASAGSLDELRAKLDGTCARLFSARAVGVWSAGGGTVEHGVELDRGEDIVNEPDAQHFGIDAGDFHPHDDSVIGFEYICRRLPGCFREHAEGILREQKLSKPPLAIVRSATATGITTALHAFSSTYSYQSFGFGRPPGAAHD